MFTMVSDSLLFAVLCFSVFWIVNLRKANATTVSPPHKNARKHIHRFVHFLGVHGQSKNPDSSCIHHALPFVCSNSFLPMS